MHILPSHTTLEKEMKCEVLIIEEGKVHGQEVLARPCCCVTYLGGLMTSW